MPLFLGIEDSYSDYHVVEPVLFPLATIGVSFGLWMHKEIQWKISSVLLIIIALFNVADWPVIHNTAAILFSSEDTFLLDNSPTGFFSINVSSKESYDGSI